MYRPVKKECKHNALNLCKEPGYTTAQVAKNLGISESLLYKWRNRYEQKSELAFSGNGREALTEEQRVAATLPKSFVSSCFAGKDTKSLLFAPWDSWQPHHRAD